MTGNSLLLTTLPPVADRSGETAQAATDRSATTKTGTETFDQIMASASGGNSSKPPGGHHAAAHGVKHTQATALTPLLTKAPSVAGQKKAAETAEAEESASPKPLVDVAALLAKKPADAKKPSTPQQDGQEKKETATQEADADTDVNQTDDVAETKANTASLVSDVLIAQLLAPARPEPQTKLKTLKGSAAADPVSALAPEKKADTKSAAAAPSTPSAPLTDVVTQAKNRPAAKATVKATVTAIDAQEESKTPPSDAIVQNAKELPTALTGAKSSHGTAGALVGPQMKFTAEKDETAGSTAQKVPVVASRTSLSTKAETGGEDLSSFERPAGKDVSTSGSVALTGDFQALSAKLDVTAGQSSSVSPTSASHTAAQQVETLGRMVNQHVSMLRQSGATNLSLSLKLDSQTELNLQLTSHNGQVEAALRFERGSVPGMDAHWRDLQDSLAKQNVQLLPLDTRSVSRVSASSSTPDGQMSYSHQERSAQYSQQQGREARREYVSVADWQTSVSVKPQTTKTRSAQGWEALA